MIIQVQSTDTLKKFNVENVDSGNWNVVVGINDNQYALDGMLVSNVKTLFGNIGQFMKGQITSFNINL